MPNLSMPVTRDQVIQMVHADTGSQSAPNQVQMSPTAAACSLQGGAFVDLGGNDYPGYYNFTGTNVSLVLDRDGKIVHYERDPSR